MSLVLTHEEIRVLGALIEKDMATPEYYPMSLNALVNACNQKTNRDPIVAFTEEQVRDTLEDLRSKQLITVLTGGGNRVPKYGHRASELLNLNNRELAVICVLLLRGAQTLNEIRTRAESLHGFDDLDSVETVLRRLAGRGMAVLLEKAPGAREPRWTHLVAGEPVAHAPAGAPDAEPSGEEREALAARLARLEAELAALREEFAEFRRQFQ